MNTRESASGRSYKDVLVQAVHSLANSTGLQAVIEEMEPRQRVGADAIINVREENKRWRFYVEVKPHLTSHTLGAAILAVSQIKKEHHSAALVSAYINPSQAEKLRELGIEFFDAAGNASFQQKGRKELLKRWTSAYPEQLRPKLILGRFKSGHARDWWQKVDLPSDAFWGGEVAAKLLTKYLRPETVTIYAESILPRLQARHRLHRDPNGDVELLQRFWNFENWDAKNLQTAPPLLVYADLVSTADDRNLETAELIYGQYIAQLVE